MVHRLRMHNVLCARPLQGLSLSTHTQHNNFMFDTFKKSFCLHRAFGCIDVLTYRPHASSTGERCLGKSTLIETLFGEAARTPSRATQGHGTGAAEGSSATVSVEPRTVELTEAGIAVRLTIVDTPGTTPVATLCTLLHCSLVGTHVLLAMKGFCSRCLSVGWHLTQFDVVDAPHNPLALRPFFTCNRVWRFAGLHRGCGATRGVH